IKDGVSIYKAGEQPKVGALPQLPAIANNNGEQPASSITPPARGIYALTPAPHPCGCAGCSLGHIIAKGSRDVAAR
ncbi:MAG: hypothetical protein ACK58T_50310, partial [Phycisphaerae bacterium]